MNLLPLFTVGHSTRTLSELIHLLNINQVTHLIDVRSYPSSRHVPHFNKPHLSSVLPSEGIQYTHIPTIGGRRTTNQAPISDNPFWTHPSFRNYADYAQHSPEFWQGFQELLAHAAIQRCAIMCAEAQWWRCHRRIITDYALQYIPVFHIISPTATVQAQPTTPNLHITHHPRLTITYPLQPEETQPT